MGIYIILWIVIVICSLAECRYDGMRFEHVHISMKNVTFFIVFLFILLLGVFRSESLGVDQSNYYIHYNSYGQASVYDIISRWRTDDIGYFLLGKLFYVCGASFLVFKDFIYVMVVIIIGFLIYRYSDFPAFSFMILLGTGFLGVHFTLLRMSLSIAICMLSFIFLEKKRLLPFVLLVLLAATFHKSALFFILLYIIVHVGYSSIEARKKIIIITIAVILSFTVVPNLYVFYERNDYSESVVSGNGINSLIFYLVIALFHTYVYRRQSKWRDGITNDNAQIMEVTTWSTVYMQIEAVAFSLMSRVVYFFSGLQCISLPGLLKSRRSRWFIFSVYLILFSIMYFRQLIGNGYKIVPYVSIFG